MISDRVFFCSGIVVSTMPCDHGLVHEWNQLGPVYRWHRRASRHSGNRPWRNRLRAHRQTRLTAASLPKRPIFLGDQMSKAERDDYSSCPGVDIRPLQVCLDLCIARFCSTRRSVRWVQPFGWNRFEGGDYVREYLFTSETLPPDRDSCCVAAKHIF